jgi:hypothetical protein
MGAYQGADAREPVLDTPMCGSMRHVSLSASGHQFRHGLPNLDRLLRRQQLAVGQRVGRLVDLQAAQLAVQLTRGEGKPGHAVTQARSHTKQVWTPGVYPGSASSCFSVHAAVDWRCDDASISA